MIAARVIGHRGCAAHAPENTLAGLREAAARGVTWVEIDVCLLGDGTPVIIHDATVDRTTNGRGALADLDWARVAQLDAGSWFSAKFAGERVPRLDQALAEVGALGVGLNLELKTHAKEGARLVGAAVPMLQAAGLPHAKLLVSSFDHTALAAFRAAAPDRAIAVLYRDIPLRWQLTASALKAVAINASYRHATEAAVRSVKAAGLDVYLYTPRVPGEVAPMWAWGVDGVFADDPTPFLLSRN
jgi:glycerophosphoryl diester phosphodiesterase